MSNTLNANRGDAGSGGGTVNFDDGVTGVLPVANGGTNSSTALANGKVMASSGGKIVESTIAPTQILKKGTFTSSSISSDASITAAFTNAASLAAVTGLQNTITVAAGDEIEVGARIVVSLAAHSDIIWGYSIDSGTPAVMGYIFNDTAVALSYTIYIHDYVTGLSAASHQFDFCAAKSAGTTTLKGSGGSDAFANSFSCVQR